MDMVLSSDQLIVDCVKISLSLLFLKVDRSQLSQPLPVSHILWSLTILGSTGEPQTWNRCSLDAAPQELKRDGKCIPATAGWSHTHAVTHY